jgi:hypothetical protein
MGSTVHDRLRGLFNGATGTVRADDGSQLIVGSSHTSTKLHAGVCPISLSLDGTWIFRPTWVSNFESKTDDFLDKTEGGRRMVKGKLTFVVREGAGPSNFRALRQAAFWHLSNEIDQFSGAVAASLVDRLVAPGEEPPFDSDVNPLFDGL